MAKLYQIDINIYFLLYIYLFDDVCFLSYNVVKYCYISVYICISH
jgi:hypothetical protein